MKEVLPIDGWTLREKLRTTVVLIFGGTNGGRFFVRFYEHHLHSRE